VLKDKASRIMKTSILNNITTFVWRMIRLNFFFTIANAVLVFALLFIPFHIISLPLYILAAFLFVPSLVGLVSAIKRTDDASPPLRKLYFRCYCEEFKDSLRFAVMYIAGALVLFAMFIFAQDAPNMGLIMPLYFVLAIVLYVHFILAILIRVNFIIDFKGTLRLGLYCISKYPPAALLILATTIALGLLIPVVPMLLPFGAIPAMFYLFLATTKKMINDISDVVLIAENKEDKTIESKDDSK